MIEYKISLPDFGGIEINVKASKGGGSISSNMHEKLSNAIDDQDLASIKKWNSYMDAMESIVLAHACAGIEVDSRAYVQGLNDAYAAYGQYIDIEED